MKKIFSMAVLIALVAAPAMAATIVGSKHDMINSGFATNAGGATEVCVFCHTPHNAQPGIVPLWNNTIGAEVQISMYAGAPNRSGAGNTLNFPTDQTKINATDARVCLACHDSAGVTLPMNAPNVGTLALAGTMGVDTILTTDMRNDHPIGMDIGSAPEVTDAGIKSIAAIKGSFGGVTPFYGSTDDSVNIMWCSSCHDVHNGDPNLKPFLRLDNTGSALCKACHKK